MTLRTRLAFALIAIGAVLIVPLAISLRSLDRLHETTTNLRDRDFRASLLVGRMRAGVEDLRRAEVLTGTVPDTGRIRMRQALDAFGAMADTLDRFDLDSAARGIHQAVTDLRAGARSELAAASSGQGKVADSISTNVQQPAIARAERWVSKAEQALNQRTRSRVELAASTSAQAQRFAILALVIALAIAAGVAIWLARSISGPVWELRRGMRAVADGDFGHRLMIRSSGGDEFAQLAQSFSTMSAQLAELDKLKAEFVSVASHELKTPLNVIQGYLQLFQEGIYGPLSEKQLEVCGTLLAQCESLGRLIRHLLDVSRFEAGGGKLDARKMRLDDFLDSLERSFSVLAMQREIHFKVERGHDLPPTVVWDADRINEVLGNLLSNAFKFTNRGGRVTLSVKPTDGEMVEMRVQDTGAGIAPEQLPKIFQKFYQADNQDAASARGTGLGLAIAKTIIEAHNGTIAVDSKPGVGTTFTLRLPARVSVPRRSAPQRAVRAEVS